MSGSRRRWNLRTRLGSSADHTASGLQENFEESRSSGDGVAALERDGDFCKALMLAGGGEAPLLDGFRYGVDEDGATAESGDVFDGAVRADDGAHANRAAEARVLEDIGIGGQDLLYRLG